MRFRLEDQEFEPVIAEEEVFVSPSTGARLRRLSIEFFTTDELNRRRVGRYRTGTLLTALDGQPSSSWRKIGVSSSRNDGTARWTHSWEIEEVEMVMPSTLVVGSLSLKPERYAESWIDEKLDLRCFVSVTAAENAELIRIIADGRPVVVSRGGLSGGDREMVFLSPVWSENNGAFQWVLHLEDKDEEASRPSAGALEMSVRHHAVPYLMSVVDELTALLVTKGLLSGPEVDALKERAIQAAPNRAVRMQRVEKVERFWDGQPE